MSAIIAYAINYIPGLKLRASEEAELLGMDDDQLGEFAYDYVEVRRDYLAWTPHKPQVGESDAEVPMGERHGIQEHSQMLDGKAPSGANSDDSGAGHTGIGGVRHAEAYEKGEREKRAHEE